MDPLEHLLRVPEPALFGFLVAASMVLPAAGTGDVAVAGLLVGLTMRSRAATSAVLLAVAAASLRWGTTSVDALIGAQEILGPAVTTGSTAAAASSGLGGAAVLMAARRWGDGAGGLIVAAPVGLLVALLAVGGDPGIDLPVRLGAAVPAAALATGVMYLRQRGRIDAVLSVAAVLSAAVAVVLASL